MNFKSVVSILYSNVLRVLYFGAALISTSCSNYETDYATGFSDEKFSQIETGMNEDEVIRLLGRPFEVSTHILFLDDGGSNNFKGRLSSSELNEGEKIKHYTFCYSREVNKNSDFEVCNVFIGVNGKVIGKDRYYTD